MSEMMMASNTKCPPYVREMKQEAARSDRFHDPIFPQLKIIRLGERLVNVGGKSAKDGIFQTAAFNPAASACPARPINANAGAAPSARRFRDNSVRADNR